MLSDRLLTIYHTLLEAYGPRHWWPAETPFEVVIGTILTQNTTWSNVEQAIANLAAADALTPYRLAIMPRDRLEQAIYPAGYFRQKAERLQGVATHLVDDWQADVRRWCEGPLDEVRRRLLALKGIGPETADSILLYAGQRPSFVVDAYTRRVFTRLGLLDGTERYEQVRALFMDHLPHESPLFNEYHALIVTLAKTCCHKRQPRCQHCPLLSRCPYGQESV